MYAQFFGNYLLGKEILTADQLLEAMSEQHSVHIKLGTLAIHEGYMTASEVDNVVIQQTHADKRFGEIAIEEGYLTKEQVDALIASQTPDYLLLGQILVEKGIITNSELESLIIDYESVNEILELDLVSEQKEKVNQIIRNFLSLIQDDVTNYDYLVEYLNLLFNNLVRFIGEDFTLLSPTIYPEYATSIAVSQSIQGAFSATSYLDLTNNTALEFASRYVKDTFYEIDEYVMASMEDFLNLHNGLFGVNISNEYSVELELMPPEHTGESLISSNGKTLILLPIIYPFGTLNFLISL